VTENDTYIKRMCDDLKAIREKYGLPKGILFIPDRYEIAIKRNSYDRMYIDYKEFYDFLPDTALDIFIPMQINQLTQMGIPKEKIGRIGKNCIGIELVASASFILCTVLGQLALQKWFTDQELDRMMNGTKLMRKIMTDAYDFEFKWDSAIEAKYASFLMKFGQILLENPAARIESEEVMKKYAQEVNAMKSLLDKKDPANKQ
jgi:hypothetical protein